MTLSKAQKDFILKKIDSQFDCVDLDCDGYRIRLSLERIQDLKLAVAVYVNSWCKGEWLLHPELHPEGKFYPDRYKSVYSPVKKKKIIKAFGKKRAYENFPSLDEKIHYKGTHFSTGRAAINHLVKVCDSIELVTEMPA